jgi:hypothetical protein
VEWLFYACGEKLVGLELKARLNEGPLQGRINDPLISGVSAIPRLNLFTGTPFSEGLIDISPQPRIFLVEET